MFSEKSIKRFPVYSKLNILIIGQPQEERDRILRDATFWRQEVKIHYCSSPKSLTRLLEEDTVFELLVYDYANNASKWDLYKEILENCEIITLFIIVSKILKPIEKILNRDNVYCVPFGSKNTRHLNCSLRTIRNHIVRNRKYLYHLFDKAFDDYLIGLTIDNHKHNFEEGISQLLRGLRGLFDFEVVLALRKEGDHSTQIFKYDEQKNFCSLLTSKNGICKVCEDFLESHTTYIPSEFLYKDFLRFNATREKAQILERCFKNTDYCGLCHLLGYRSLIFIPFRTASQNKWMFLFADKKADKASEKICQYFEEKIPFLTAIISYLEQYWHEKTLLNLYQHSLNTGRIGVWEYEVETRKINSSGLQALFPYLKMPDELTEWWQYIHPLDRLNFWHAVKPCIQGAINTFLIDHRLLLPEDRQVWVRTIGECVSRKGKYAEKLIGIGMDITSFMESGQKLKHTKEKLQVALELSDIGLWSWDILKDEYIMNQSSIDMFRLKYKGTCNLEDWLNCIVPAQRELVRKELGETLTKEDGVLNIQYQIYYRGLYKRWIHTYGKISAKDSRGNPIRISGTHVDITDKKMLEKQLDREVIINSLYAGFARSLLKMQTEEEVTQMVCQMGVNILNSSFCFAGYYDPDAGKYFFQGIDKSKTDRLALSLNAEELSKNEPFLHRFISAGVPLIINRVESKENILFGKISTSRLLFYPSYTPSHELVLIIAVNSNDNYTPSNWESIEWMASMYAQALERIRLENKNLQKTEELERTVEQLKEALNMVKQLHGLLPICARCKKIRDDTGYWHEVEVYIREHTEAEFSHGICPQCAEELYGDFLK